MSERRFWFVIDKGKLEYVQDNITNEKFTISELEDLLNEQQATNDYLEESNSRLQIQLGETLRLVDEQQATIEQLKEENEQKKMIIVQK